MPKDTPSRRAHQRKAEPGTGQQQTAENVTQPVMRKAEPLPDDRSNADEQDAAAGSFLPDCRLLLKEKEAQRSRQEERSDGMPTRETVAGE